LESLLVKDGCQLTGVNKVDLGNLHMVEDVRLLHSSILRVGNKAVTYHEWAFVNVLQRWFKLSSFQWVVMLSTFLIMGGRICTLGAFGVSGLLDSPGTKKYICGLIELLKACKYTSRKQLGYLVLKCNHHWL
jgi:hypothetical protein